jgi:hypothetical protein
MTAGATVVLTGGVTVVVSDGRLLVDVELEERRVELVDVAGTLDFTEPPKPPPDFADVAHAGDAKAI